MKGKLVGAASVTPASVIVAAVLAGCGRATPVAGATTRHRTGRHALGVEWSTGAAAADAYQRAHPEVPDAQAPDDFVIVNRNPRPRTLRVLRDVAVTVLGSPHHGRVPSVDERYLP
jgi:hypothetical protein